MQMQNALDELRHYNQIKASVDNLAERIAIIDEQMRAINSALGNETIKGGGIDNKLDGLIDRKKELESELVIRQKQLTIMNTALDSLTDTERLIMQRFYVDGIIPVKANEILQDELCVDESTVWRLKKQVIPKYLIAAAE